jgi:TonB family protein
VDLAFSPGADDSLFAIPERSEFWTTCNNRREAKLTNRIHPNYPADARQRNEQGRVIFYAVIETDGSLSHLVQIQRAWPALDAAAAEAIRQWRYEPAACGASPVRTETSIVMDFWMEH